MTTASSAAGRLHVPVGAVLGAGVIAGVLAAVATTVVAAIARGLGVPLEVAASDATAPEPIPLYSFGFLTLLFTVVGVLVALAIGQWTRHPARTWVVTATVLTLLSFIPSLLANQATPMTKAVLVLCHVVAAAIVIPIVASRLPETRES